MEYKRARYPLKPLLRSQLYQKKTDQRFLGKTRKEIACTEKWIEGDLKPNSKVIIVEDVTTKGNSVFESIERVRELGCKVIEVISLADREEGARKRLADAGYRFTSMFTISEFSKVGIFIRYLIAD